MRALNIDTGGLSVGLSDVSDPLGKEPCSSCSHVFSSGMLSMLSGMCFFKAKKKTSVNSSPTVTQIHPKSPHASCETQSTRPGLSRINSQNGESTTKWRNSEEFGGIHKLKD